MKRRLYSGIIILICLFVLIGCPSQYMRNAMLAIRDENNPDKAIKYLQIEIKDNPENADAYLLLSKVYGQYKKNYTKAYEFAKKSAELDYEKKPAAKAIYTTCWSQLYNKGLDEFEAGDYNSSLNYFKKANRIFPDSLVTKKMLASVYIQMDSLEKAREIYMNIIEQKPDDVKTKNTLEALNVAKTTKKSDKTITPNQSSYTTGPLSIEIIKEESIGNEKVEVQIKITNISDKDIHNAIMTCVAENSSGRPLDYKKHYVIKSSEGGLNSGNSTYFTYILDANPGLVANAVFQIDNIKYK